MSEADTEAAECLVCGARIPDADDAMYGAGSVDEGRVEQLDDGETVSLDEVFNFDDGPYCGLDCMMEADDD